LLQDPPDTRVGDTALEDDGPATPLICALIEVMDGVPVTDDQVGFIIFGACTPF